MDDQSVVVCSQLIMQIKLTAKGTSQIKEVLSVVFSYIIWLQNLDNLPNYFFEEIKTMKDINFKYLEKEEPFDYVESLAGKWTFLEP